MFEISNPYFLKPEKKNIGSNSCMTIYYIVWVGCEKLYATHPGVYEYKKWTVSEISTQK